MTLVIRKASFSGSDTKQMTYDSGGTANVGPNGVPGTVVISDAVTGGVDVTITDRNGAVVFTVEASTGGTYDIDDMSCNLCAGPLSCQADGACDVTIYVDE